MDARLTEVGERTSDGRMLLASIGLVLVVSNLVLRRHTVVVCAVSEIFTVFRYCVRVFYDAYKSLFHQQKHT